MSSVTITLSNPALKVTPATLYAGVAATLNLTLSNTTGAAIGLDEQSQLEIFLPQYFSDAQVKQMALSNITPAGWKFTPGEGSLLLSWLGGKAGWSGDTPISFSIDKVFTDAAPDTGAVQVNLNQLSGDGVPPNVSVTLVLEKQPAPGNARLSDRLAIDNQFGGAIYVSTAANALTNTLYLNLRNISDKPLYSGEKLWSGTPQIKVSFVYGTTAGALAPADKQQSARTGSAWTIDGSLFVDQTGGWQVVNPRSVDQANTPVWTLLPTATNRNIIGTGAEANVTFAFKNIVSQTPVGATQMYVQLSGFMADEHTLYDDAVFVIPLVKQTPPNPGGINIACLADSIAVKDESQEIPIPLTWSMFGVGSVRLNFYVPGMTIPDVRYTYGAGHAALNYDTQSPKIKGIQYSTLLRVYCWLYADTDGKNFLNKIECTVPLDFTPSINSFTIEASEVKPPYSYAFLLKWQTKGAKRFTIIADDGGPPYQVFVPEGDTSCTVHPVQPETKYTLNIYGGTGSAE